MRAVAPIRQHFPARVATRPESRIVALTSGPSRDRDRFFPAEARRSSAPTMSTAVMFQRQDPADGEKFSANGGPTRTSKEETGRTSCMTEAGGRSRQYSRLKFLNSILPAPAPTVARASRHLKTRPCPKPSESSRLRCVGVKRYEDNRRYT